VFAAWSGTPYSPGDTLNPECLPTDTNCDVLLEINQTMYIGTTAQATNRASAPETLSGITGLTPGANFTLTQNSVVPFTSVESGAVANTLYLKTGNVGVGTTTP